MTQWLAEISVLDLSIWRPGPYATSLLAYLGADVLKVEPPGGDPMRQFPELFESVNAGKRGVMLDLKVPDQRSRALALANAADVIVEGFRPGVIGRLGLDEGSVRATNPRVVYCSISGYGQDGPRSRLPGHDVNYQAWAGALTPEGGTGTMPPLPTADLASGMAAAFGICAALIGRGVSGRGSYLDISMTDVMATWTGGASVSSPSTHRTSPSVPGYGLFDTADAGQVALGIVNEQHFWSALCNVVGLEHWSNNTYQERVERSEEINPLLRTALGSRTRDDLVTSLTLAGVPVAPVLDRRTMLAGALLPDFPIRFDPPSSELPSPSSSAPGLDEHRGQGFLRRDPRSTSHRSLPENLGEQSGGPADPIP